MLPLTAALLAATPVQMGLLAAAETLPFLLIGLPAGAWVDRWRRRPVMVLADLGRALVLAAIPAAWLAGWLRMELIYAVGFLAGLLTVFFDVAYQVYLPALVARDELVEGNSKLELSRSVAQLVGPGLAGGLVQVAGGPLAILIDAVSFALSALCLRGIRRREPPLAPAGRRHRAAEIGAGLRLVLGTPVPRGLAGCTATGTDSMTLLFFVLILFATRELELGPGLVGVLFSLGGGARTGWLDVVWCSGRRRRCKAVTRRGRRLSRRGAGRHQAEPPCSAGA